MGQVLYRTYRPKSLKEIVGQSHITTTLEHALKQNTISHAYLFTGPKGVGKTSIARILAHEVNGLPYIDDSNHLDIIEIDAASNRRIDEIRDLRDKVHVTPTSAKYKVYIIDEVHMLTREAFNALLKTLEEPPAHVIFILATTEAHKLPETIISRTQRFTFKPIAFNETVVQLRKIADKEKIEIDDEALKLIAEHGDGSFRDSTSLLDQARNQIQKVTRDSVLAMLGIASEAAIDGLLQAVHEANSSAVVKVLNELSQQGYEAGTIAKQLGKALREQLLGKTATFSPQKSLELLRQLLDVPIASNPKVMLELLLLSASLKDEPQPLRGEADVIAKSPTVEAKQKPEVSTVAQKSDVAKPEKKMSKFSQDIWPQVLEAIKREHNTLYSILRMAKPEFSESEIELSFEFAFHQKRLNEAKNRQIVAKTVYELTGEDVAIVCVVGEYPNTTKSSSPVASVEKSRPQKNSSNDNSIDAISNIFGSAELLES